MSADIDSDTQTHLYRRLRTRLPGADRSSRTHRRARLPHGHLYGLFGSRSDGVPRTRAAPTTSITMMIYISTTAHVVTMTCVKIGVVRLRLLAISVSLSIDRDDHECCLHSHGPLITADDNERMVRCVWESDVNLQE
jgi:hypothetical protein